MLRYLYGRMHHHHNLIIVRTIYIAFTPGLPLTPPMKLYLTSFQAPAAAPALPAEEVVTTTPSAISTSAFQGETDPQKQIMVIFKEFRTMSAAHEVSTPICQATNSSTFASHSHPKPDAPFLHTHGVPLEATLSYHNPYLYDRSSIRPCLLLTNTFRRSKQSSLSVQDWHNPCIRTHPHLSTQILL